MYLRAPALKRLDWDWWTIRKERGVMFGVRFRIVQYVLDRILMLYVTPQLYNIIMICMCLIVYCISILPNVPPNCCNMKINIQWKRRYRFIHRTAATTGPLPIKGALKTDQVTILSVYQMLCYSFNQYNMTQLQWKYINFDVLTLCKYNYPHGSTATTRPPPIERE